MLPYISNRKCDCFGKYHQGQCRIICENMDCEKYKAFHENGCFLMCYDENCTRYGEYHQDRCSLKCKNINCNKHGEYHKGKCFNLCKNKKCTSSGLYHKGKCTMDYSIANKSNCFLKNSNDGQHKKSKKMRNEIAVTSDYRTDLLHANSYLSYEIKIKGSNQIRDRANIDYSNQNRRYKKKSSYSCCVCISSLLVILFVASVAMCIYLFLSDFL